MFIAFHVDVGDDGLIVVIHFKLVSRCSSVLGAEVVAQYFTVLESGAVAIGMKIFAGEPSQDTAGTQLTFRS